MAEHKDTKGDERPPDATKPESTDPLTLTSITPDTMPVGEPDFEVIATGTGFTNNCMLTFNRINVPETEFHDSHKISAILKTADISVAAMRPVTVKRGFEESNELPFTFTPELTPQAKAAKAKADVEAKKAKVAEMTSRPTMPPPQRGFGAGQSVRHDPEKDTERQPDKPDFPKSRR